MNARAQTVQLLEENIGVNVCALGLGDGFLDRTPKAQANKEKINLIKISKFCALKHTTKEVQRSRVCKELSQLNNKNTTQLKNGKGFKQTFLRGRYTNGQQGHKKMLNIIVTRETQIIKATTGYYIKPMKRL